MLVYHIKGINQVTEISCPLSSDVRGSHCIHTRDSGGDDTKNYIIGQFTKFKHDKFNWNVLLVDGILHIHGRDILFGQCKGSYKWIPEKEDDE